MSTPEYGFGSPTRTHVFFQAAFVLAAIWLAVQFLALLLPLLVPLLISFFLAYFCNPVVTRLERRGLPRTGGILILLFFFVNAVVLFMMLVVPVLSQQLEEFIQKVPSYTQTVKDHIVPWVERMFHATLPNASDAAAMLVERFGKDVKLLASEAAYPIREIAGFAMAGTLFIFSLVVTIFLIPFFTFFLLRDFEKLHDRWMSLIPLRHREWMQALMHDMDSAMSSWLRGQVLVMIILGTLYSIGYTFVGIPLSLFVGLLTGFMAFIPYVGAFLGFLLALVMAALDGSWASIAGVVIVFGTVQLADAFFITPNVLGKSVGLNPAIVVISLMAFGILWGFWGALVAVPMAAVLAVLIRHLFQLYRKSVFFTRS